MTQFHKLKEVYFDRYCIDPEQYIHYWGCGKNSWLDYERTV